MKNNEKVPRVKLNSGHRMPQLGLGTWEMSQKEAEESVLFALQNGYRLIDTAALYGNEEGVGKGIKRAEQELGIKRGEVFVTTKIWNSDHSNPRKAIEQSLARLGLDYVDLYLIHWPVREALQTWKHFEGFKKEGLAKSIGVSNFTIDHLEKLFAVSKEVPSVNQVEFSPFLFQKELLDYCKGKGIKLMSYSPLTHGNALGDKVLASIAEKYKKTPAQIVLRWHLQLGAIPIPKSKTEERITSNIDVFGFELSDSQMRQMSALNRGLRYCWDPNSARWKFLGEAAKLLKPRSQNKF